MREFCLRVVRVEATELDVEDLAADAKAGAACDDACDGLQRSGEWVVGQHVGVGIEELRWIGHAAGPAGAMAVTSAACACIERLITTSYSLAKRLVSSEVRIEFSGLAAAGMPNGGC